MTRRSLFTVIMLVALTVAGCLGEPTGFDGSGNDNGQGDGDPTEAPDTDRHSEDEAIVHETMFEVLDVRTSDENESASVTVNDEAVTVTGVIRGNNGCYTARLSGAVISAGTLTVNIESYEDAAEDQDCTQAIVAIEFKATVETDVENLKSVTVKYNADPIMSTEV